MPSRRGPLAPPKVGGRSLLAALLAFTLFSACTAAADPATDLVGTWGRAPVNPVTLTFNEDGTYTVISPSSFVEGGDWSVDENGQLTIYSTDRFSVCFEDTGVYDVSHEEGPDGSDVLDLEVISDECAQRSGPDDMPGGSFTRVDDQPSEEAR